jgi:CRAL/TRIO domain
MEKICAACAKDPSAHSFKKIAEKNGVCIFYTKPAMAGKYNDTAGFIAHMDHALHSIGNKKWMLLFDGDGFESKHVLALEAARDKLPMFENKYGEHLQQVVFINPSWHVKLGVKAVMLVLHDKIKSKLKLLDDRVYSVLEFL